MAAYKIKDGSIKQVGDYMRCFVCFKEGGKFEYYEVRTFEEEQLRAHIQIAADKLEDDNKPREKSEM